MTDAETVLLVYDADGGLAAKLLDAAKKALGREECALCEITYSPVGKRRLWEACEARLTLPIKELHRDELPEVWGIRREELPCVLFQTGTTVPVLLLRRDEIHDCRGDAMELERRLTNAISALRAPRSS